MKEKARDLGMRGVALLVLLVVAWVLFKFVIGVVTAVAWTVVVIIAVIAGIWALTRLF
ncbi:MAG: hypothetical protein QOJ07_3750 [Thermoleophilaceae bacterium]|nr:hypothetical protein [Thermoleophilaceae bacterium]